MGNYRLLKCRTHEIENWFMNFGIFFEFFQQPIRHERSDLSAQTLIRETCGLAVHSTFGKMQLELKVKILDFSVAT